MTIRIRNRTAQLAGVAMVIGLMWPAAALAQKPPVQLSEQTLEDLMKLTVTTATRTAQDARTAPAVMIVITADDIARRGYRSLTDVLKGLPEFKVDLAGDQDYPVEVSVLGMRGASRLVVMLDGVRITSPSGEPIPIYANYPVNEARQVEIMLGAASSLYGADAFSAVINIISRTAEESSGLALSASAGQFGLGHYTGTFGRRFSRGGSLTVSGQVFLDQQPDLSRYYPLDFGGLQGQKSGTFNTIFGPMTPSPAPSPQYDIPASAHAFHAAYSAGGWNVMLFESRSRLPTPPANTPDNASYSDDAFTGNNLLVGAATYLRQIGRLDFTSRLIVSRHEMDPNSGYRNAYSNMVKSFKYAYASSTRLEEQFSWRPFERVDVTFGGEIARVYSIPQTADLNAPVTSRSVPGIVLGTTIVDTFNTTRYVDSGAYAQLQYRWTPRVAVTVGGRLDHNTRYGANLSPRIALVTQPSTRTIVKVMAGTAYLAPSPYQAYSHYGSFVSDDGGKTYRSDFWHVPNPDLQPQTKTSVAVDVRHDVGRGLVVSASAFVARVSGLIEESSAEQSGAGMFLGWPVAYINHAVNGNGEDTYGGTLGARFGHRWSDRFYLNTHARLALVDGDVDAVGKTSQPLGLVSRAQFRAGMEVGGQDWSIAPSLNVVGAQRLWALTEVSGRLERRALDGYATVDLAARRGRLYKGLGAFLLLENVFDARYRNINARAYTNPEELIGAPQNPRRLTIGLEVRIR